MVVNMVVTGVQPFHHRQLCGYLGAKLLHGSFVHRHFATTETSQGIVCWLKLSVYNCSPIAQGKRVHFCCANTCEATCVWADSPFDSPSHCMIPIIPDDSWWFLMIWAISFGCFNSQTQQTKISRTRPDRHRWSWNTAQEQITNKSATFWTRAAEQWNIKGQSKSHESLLVTHISLNVVGWLEFLEPTICKLKLR